jgi:hypothetical protein
MLRHGAVKASSIEQKRNRAFAEVRSLDVLRILGKQPPRALQCTCRLRLVPQLKINPWRPSMSLGVIKDEVRRTNHECRVTRRFLAPNDLHAFCFFVNLAL